MLGMLRGVECLQLQDRRADYVTRPAQRTFTMGVVGSQTMGPVIKNQQDGNQMSSQPAASELSILTRVLDLSNLQQAHLQAHLHRNTTRRYRRLHVQLPLKQRALLLFTNLQNVPPRPLNQQVSGSGSVKWASSPGQAVFGVRP